MFVFAIADVLCAEQTVYYWNNIDGGAWNKADNWVVEDGTPATTYPHVAGDVAVFNGLAAYKTVYVNQSDVIDIDELRLDDGCMRLSFRNSDTLHFHADRFVRSMNAVLYLVTDGGYNHAQPPAGLTIGNRADVLFNGGFLPGVVVCKDGSGWEAPRSATILEDGTLKYASLDEPAMAYGVNGDSTWSKNVTLFYGNHGDWRHISFNKECVLTVPCGQIGPLSNNSHVGNPSGPFSRDDRHCRHDALLLAEKCDVLPGEGRDSAVRSERPLHYALLRRPFVGDKRIPRRFGHDEAGLGSARRRGHDHNEPLRARHRAGRRELGGHAGRGGGGRAEGIGVP